MVFTSLSVVMAHDSVDETTEDPGLDKIVMVSGEVKRGKVTGMSHDEVRFVHDKETLTYTFSKSKISKIEFGASGRIEVYNQVQMASAVAPNLSDHHNKIAILPFAYVRAGRQLTNDINETKLQQEFFNLMQGHVGSLNIQVPQTTKALLAKNGVMDESSNNYMIPEVANMPGSNMWCVVYLH